MVSIKLRRSIFIRSVFAVVLSLALHGALRAQADPPKPAQSDQGQSQQTSPTTSPTPPSKASPQAQPEVKITPQEAEELFHSVDEILAFDSKHSGLPIKREVKKRLTSRDEVVAFLTKHMKDEDVKRLQRSELVLKKFGLLPSRLRSGEASGLAAARANRWILRSQNQNGKSARLGSD